MKWLTIDYIKQHSRLDFSDEDSVLDLYGSAAEETVLNYLNRTYQELLEQYGEVPAPIRQATLLLVDHSYTQRSPASAQNMSIVPYSFDILVKPYMRLTGSAARGKRVMNYTLGSQLKILIAAELPDDLEMLDVDFEVVVYNDDAKDKTKVYAKTDCILTDEGDYVVLVDSDELGVGTYMVKATFQIPDSDFPTGYRKEVVRINPNVKVTG